VVPNSVAGGVTSGLQRVVAAISLMVCSSSIREKL
jgi:hypothetical protein